jgi:hypothetical protein
MPVKPPLLLLLLGVGVMSPLTRAAAQDARADIEAQYLRLADAIRLNNVEKILAIQAPDFSSINVNGARFDYAAMERYTRQMTSVIDSVIHIRNRIRTFQQLGDTAIADVCQEFSRIQRIGDRGPRRVDTSVLQRERWVRKADGWRRLQVDSVRGTRWFVDGVRVDATRPYTEGLPPYAPAVDPPTGCGLR